VGVVDDLASGREPSESVSQAKAGGRGVSAFSSLVFSIDSSALGLGSP
jgi:hypothetical protein